MPRQQFKPCVAIKFWFLAYFGLLLKAASCGIMSLQNTQQMTFKYRTNGVLMLAPYDPQEPSDESNKSTSQEEPAPQLRISGSELKKLMQEGTTESTWPKLQKQTTRPPLPFKKSNVPSQPASRPLSPMGSQARRFFFTVNSHPIPLYT